MTVPAGTRFGPYEIVAPIGAGGMGEVYRARDTRLDRSVAVKILPAEVAHDVQLRTRFEREAKTISQLNHPNICTLHDVGENFLVMELLEGETLADRIARGPLPLDQVLRFGAEIARALDGAHRHGVTHRDLKPANVMITKSGAKVLDFGLARTVSEVNVDLGGATVQRTLTAEGTIIGTFQYMAPEQLEAGAVDARTDIFALGAVLYEMATGRRAFDGKTKTSLIAAIVAAEPKPIHELQPLTPPAFERLVTKCLAKDPDERWQSAHDVADELTWIAETVDRQKSEPAVRGARTWKIASAVLALALTGVVAAALLTRRKAEPPMTLSLTMPTQTFEFYSQAVLSPDGETLAFVGHTKNGSALWIRPIGTSQPRMLPGTEKARMPFWSPDGKALGFFADGKLKRIFVAGGPPQLICDAPASFGGTWNRDNVILFAATYTDPIMRVDANGGKPQPVTRLEKGEEAHRWPSFLPDGEHFVFLGDAPRTEDHFIRLGSLEDGKSVKLAQAVTHAVAPDGKTLFFVRGGSLMAQPLDLGAKKLTGQPRVIAEHVVPNWQNHHFEFSVAGNGRLVYRTMNPNAQLTWLDRTGKVVATVGEPRVYGEVRISRDQKRIVTSRLDADGRGDDVWLIDPARGMTTRFTFDPAADYGPVWSPDGQRVAFASMRSSFGDVYVADVGNPVAARRLTNSGEATTWPRDWSPDGKHLAVEFSDRTNTDVALYSFESGQVRPHAATRFEEYSPVFSPDGRQIAYVSEESGRPEIYVEQFPSRAERRQVTTGGALSPRWSADGRELFFLTEGALRSVDLSDENATPRLLFATDAQLYDVSADGQQFLLAVPMEHPAGVPLTFVSGWRE
jgi:Tol biopolymer transport system component/predicted Ser/Thr protein kinase